MWSAIIKGLSAMFQGIATALNMAQANEQRNEGAVAQQNVDRKAENDALKSALGAANNSDPGAVTDKLRNGSF